MQKCVLNLELLREAQAGNRQSMEQLGHLVQGRMYAYLYRMTLNPELAEEITQQIQVRLWHSLVNESFDFEHANQFLAWLYRSAKGDLQNYYRCHKAISMDRIDFQADTERLVHCEDGLEYSSRLELAESIVDSLNALALDRRHILTLRIFEKLSYLEIGSILGCSEIKARVNFYRAKKELQKCLRQRGYGKVFFLPALVLFDRLTHPAQTQAAIVSTPITAATIYIGPVALIVSAVISLPSVLLTSLAIGVALLAFAGERWRAMTAYPARSEVYNMVIQREGYTLDPDTGRKITSRSWSYYPEGIYGPYLYREAKVDFDNDELIEARIQNRQGNIVYNAITRTATLVNHLECNPQKIFHRCSPLDTPDFYHHALWPRHYKFHFDRWSGLLTDYEDWSGDTFSSPYIHMQYNQPFTESIFEIETIPGIQIRDERDEVHKQGQLNVCIEGIINGQDVTGVMHMPLNYSQHLDAPPWLDIRWGSLYRLIDGPQGANLYNDQEHLLTKYPAYSFFRGLEGPWYNQGIYNSLVRDAMLFDYTVTQQKPPKGYQTKLQWRHVMDSVQTRSRQQQQADVLVINISTRRFSHWLTYTLDTYHDQIDQIEIKEAGPRKQIRTVGCLQFAILDTKTFENRPTPPETPTAEVRKIEPLQDFWLFSLLIP